MDCTLLTGAFKMGDLFSNFITYPLAVSGVPQR